MMGKYFGVALFLVMSGLNSANSGDEELLRSCMMNAKTNCDAWVNRALGGEFPRGLSTNETAELARGEKYLLRGQIQILRGRPFLAIDLSFHPWLRSTARVVDPFYRIEGDPARFRRWDGRVVDLLVVADQAIWAIEGAPDRFRVEIFLRALREPMMRFAPATSR